MWSTLDLNQLGDRGERIWHAAHLGKLVWSGWGRFQYFQEEYFARNNEPSDGGNRCRWIQRCQDTKFNPFIYHQLCSIRDWVRIQGSEGDLCSGSDQVHLHPKRRIRLADLTANNNRRDWLSPQDAVRQRRSNGFHTTKRGLLRVD